MHYLLSYLDGNVNKGSNVQTYTALCSQLEETTLLSIRVFSDFRQSDKFWARKGQL